MLSGDISLWDDWTTGKAERSGAERTTVIEAESC